MTEERRSSPRQPASLAGEIETNEGRQAIAITRDVSTSGLMLFTRLREPNPGDAIKLRVMMGDQEVNVTGTVIRAEVVDPDESTLWRNRIAVSIDPSPVYEQLAAKLIEQK